MSDKYAAIAADQGRYSIVLMCGALGVSVSGFYAAQQRAPSARAIREESLRHSVRTVFATTRGRYGAPRIQEELRDAGERTSTKRVARLMQEDGLVARGRRRFVHTTTSAHADPIADNLLDRDVAIGDTRALDTAWVGDITYVPTRAGFLYLAVLLDVASRRVIGWSMHTTLETRLPLAALEMALLRRAPSAGTIHHSDRGSQYASQAYRAVLTTHGFRQSMSRKGNCWDNAVAESFFATLEHELLASADFHTHTAARHALFEFIEVWYNRQRRHSSLGSISPATYEAQRLVA